MRSTDQTRNFIYLFIIKIVHEVHRNN